MDPTVCVMVNENGEYVDTLQLNHMKMRNDNENKQRDKEALREFILHVHFTAPRLVVGLLCTILLCSRLLCGVAASTACHGARCRQYGRAQLVQGHRPVALTSLPLLSSLFPSLCAFNLCFPRMTSHTRCRYRNLLEDQPFTSHSATTASRRSTPHQARSKRPRTSPRSCGTFAVIYSMRLFSL